MAGKKDKVKDKDRFSIVIPGLRKCYVCRTTEDIHLHEVFGGSNRAKSKEDGCVISLCGNHHNMSKAGIHFNKGLDEHVKQQTERIWIETYCDDSMSKEEKINAFIKRYGINYLEEDELGN